MQTFHSLVLADATREQLEAWCRERVQVMPAGNDAVLCRVLGKYLMYAHQRDSALTPHLALNGIWEPWISMAIARHVRPGMFCMDVGACYGYYSLLMADIVGDQGHVEAWEPVWHELASLNADVNGLPVVVLPNPLSAQSGVTFEILDPGRDTMFNAGNVPMVRCQAGAHQSFARHVDTLARGGATFDFIKIDVEGSEADVWQALALTRDRSPNLTVCMEFTPGKHEDPELFLALIQDDGFDLGTVGADGVPRACSAKEALVPDTGDFRMLWLTRRS